MVPSRFGDKSNLAVGNCHRSTVWLGSSVVRVGAQYARSPGFNNFQEVSVLVGRALACGLA